ncbi:MAG: 16S rRNA (uracil(1498)-N(3))-methyltransferase [Chloroflexi bacterium]|nr:16S rRNA (uracil(1498)-N(3))-methyltransferase [Chloroflexota bacterium]MCL5074373.1 16S rRNA (uracil(1498)-N(3))-methyltransferase [Chloroflexota bacterium]
MHRFFVSPQVFNRATAVITGPLVHQIVDVLRLGMGDRLLLLDNSGWQYQVVIKSVSPEQIIGSVEKKSLVTSEPRTKITVFQGLLRTNRFEFALQKCTEIGVVAFVPIICERSIIAEVREVSELKMGRWQRIIVEAAEQARRGKIPVLHPPMLFAQACKQARGISLLAWESQEALSIKAALHELSSDRIWEAMHREGAKDDQHSPRKIEWPFSVNLFIGPEGGFSAAEVEKARSYNIKPVSLGLRILRAETAAIVAASLILYETGDIGS